MDLVPSQRVGLMVFRVKIIPCELSLTWQTEGLETTTLKLQLPLMMSCAGYIGLMKLMNISEPWWPQLKAERDRETLSEMERQQ